LDIPKEYGVDDVPLVLQDKRFNSDEGIDYNLGMRDVMNGLQGDTMLVNGAVNPFLEVPRGMMRLRLLNGSNRSEEHTSELQSRFPTRRSSDLLDIPKEYGVDDVPLVLQDKRFNSDEGIDYNLGMRDVMNGLQGDTMLVNGAVNPFLEVPRGMMRLRLLNGSNASVYE